MTTAASLLGLVLLSVPVTGASAQTASPSAPIVVTRTIDGCNITLSPEVAKAVTDQTWLVIDGKSESFGGGDCFTDDAAKPLHFVANISDDLDGQVKDILKAQGLPTKLDIITYHLSYGMNRSVAGSISQTLHFRHGSNILTYTPLLGTTTHKVGDKITLIDAVMPDSSITMQQALGPHNDIFSGKFAPLPNDLLHRITIQVQFVPKIAERFNARGQTRKEGRERKEGKGEPCPYVLRAVIWRCAGRTRGLARRSACLPRSCPRRAGATFERRR